MDTNEQGNEASQERSALRRRALLKAAVGTGASVAAYSVSAVPAYGLTTSTMTDNRCYSFGWSANNPDGKGWMKLSDQPSATNNFVRGPNFKASNNPTPTTTVDCGNGTWTDSAGGHSGTASCTDACFGEADVHGPVRYTWTITGIGELGTGTFNLSIILSGSVNGGGTSVTVEGLPAGYCVDFYNDGRPNKQEAGSSTVCGYTTNLRPVGGGGQLTMNSRTTGFITQFSGSTGACDSKVTDGGKWFWQFDVKPCPTGGGFYA
jgi:hypothetical protein